MLNKQITTKYNLQFIIVLHQTEYVIKIFNYINTIYVFDIKPNPKLTNVLWM